MLNGTIDILNFVKIYFNSILGSDFKSNSTLQNLHQLKKREKKGKATNQNPILFCIDIPPFPIQLSSPQDSP